MKPSRFVLIGMIALCTVLIGAAVQPMLACRQPKTDLRFAFPSGYLYIGEVQGPDGITCTPDSGYRVLHFNLGDFKLYMNTDGVVAYAFGASSFY